MGTRDTTTNVDTDHNRKAPPPSLRLKGSCRRLRRGDGEIDAYAEEKVNKRLLL